MPQHETIIDRAGIDVASVSPPARYTDELSLAAFLLTLWRFRLLLAGAAVLAGSTAVLVRWNTAPVYEASSKLLVSLSKLGEQGTQVRIGDYQAMVSNEKVILDTIAELGLTAPPHRFSLSNVMGRNISIDTLRDTNIIVITARLTDPNLAAKLANRLAERAVQHARQLSQEDTIAARDTIKAQLDESRSRFDEALRRLGADVTREEDPGSPFDQ